ncbi:MAG: hypothetical protein H6521_15735 [Mycolicibacterium sp.]|nr:hypothetical protein [Mycolicibacterium sp.]MCB9410788.1 hypothetical protein [Mycolicibacterium sp.]
MALDERVYHLRSDTAASRGGSNLYELNLQALVTQLRYTPVSRIDSAGVIEFDPRHLDVVLQHPHQPGVISELSVPPMFVLVSHVPIKRRRPKAIVGGPAVEVEKLKGHGYSTATAAVGM